MTELGNDTVTEPRPGQAAPSGVGPSVVLACFDRTDASSNAVAYAAGMATRTGARLVVLTVEQSLAPDCPDGMRACVDRVSSEVERLVGDCTAPCEIAVEAGDPAGVIQRLATELQADLTIVGQCRHPWAHPLGSVPGRLIRQAKQPVLIVP